MRKYIFLFFVFLYFFSPQVLAHGPGQPPMFKINGKYSDYYPIQTNTSAFILPQDIAPELYLINQPIVFELDVKQLSNSVSEEVLKNTAFTWDFGDGAHGTGIKNSHTYTKQGSYMLTILGAYEENGQKVSEQVVQTVLLHVLPNKEYQLPKAVIKINGTYPERDSLNNPTSVNLKQYVYLDASESKAQSSKIISYYWDFGNNKSGTENTYLYQYDQSVLYVVPVVRVTDENGFFVDAYGALLHDSKVSNFKPSNSVFKLSENQSNLFFTIIYSIAGGVFAVGIFFMAKMLLKTK